MHAKIGGVKEEKKVQKKTGTSLLAWSGYLDFLFAYHGSFLIT